MYVFLEYIHNMRYMRCLCMIVRCLGLGRGYVAKRFIPCGALFLCDHALVSQWYTRDIETATPLLCAISDLAVALLSHHQYAHFIHSLSYAGSELNNFQGIQSTVPGVDDDEFRKVCRRTSLNIHTYALNHSVINSKYAECNIYKNIEIHICASSLWCGVCL